MHLLFPESKVFKTLKESYMALVRNSAVVLALIVAYFVFENAITKIMPILFLTTISLYSGETEFEKAYGSSIGTGLMLSSVGDIALEIGEDDFNLFLGGLVFFLLAHLYYIRAFVINTKILTLLPFLLLVSGYFLGMMAIILPGVESQLFLPVSVYGIVIASMGYLAVSRFACSSVGSISEILALVGALFFIASDSVLAVNKFRYKIPRAKMIVMLTYYFGQTLIAFSACSSSKRTHIN